MQTLSRLCILIVLVPGHPSIRTPPVHMLSVKVCRHRECWAFLLPTISYLWSTELCCVCVVVVVVSRVLSSFVLYLPTDLWGTWVGAVSHFCCSWGITTFCLGCVCATRHGPGIVYLYDHSVALWTSSGAKPLIAPGEDSARCCWPEKVQFTRLPCYRYLCWLELLWRKSKRSISPK